MLEGKKIVLRAFEEEDIVFNLNWQNDIEFQNLFLGTRYPISECEEYEWYKAVIKDKSKLIFSIKYKEDNKYIGNIGISNISWINRNASFWIYIGERNYRRKGCALEATQLMIEYSFNNLNIYKIYLNVLEKNIPAVKLYKKLNFEIEGTFKNEVFICGQYENILRMALIRKMKNCY